LIVAASPGGTARSLGEGEGATLKKEMLLHSEPDVVKPNTERQKAGKRSIDRPTSV
jgi:hypothetical protein